MTLKYTPPVATTHGRQRPANVPVVRPVAIKSGSPVPVARRKGKDAQ